MNWLLLVSILTFSNGESSTEEDHNIRIESTERKGEGLYTVKAKYVHLSEFLSAVSEKSGYEFKGVDAQSMNSIVNAAFVDRRMDEILRFVLGSVELKFVRSGKVVEVTPIPTAETPEGREWLIQEGIKATYEMHLLYGSFTKTASLILLISSIDEALDKIDSANERYQSILQHYPDAPEIPEALLRLGRNFARKAEFDRAYEYLSNLVNNYPKYEKLDEGYYLTGKMLLELHRIDRAEQYLQVMLEEFDKSPFRPMAAIALAEVQRQRGKTDEALKSLMTFEDEALQDPELRPDFLYVQSSVYFDLKDYKKASPGFLRFFAEFPKHHDAREALLKGARSAYSGGDLAGAVFLASTYQKQYGSDSKEWNELAAELRKDLGLKDFLVSEESAATVFSSACAYKNMGKIPQAIQLLEKYIDDPHFGSKAKLHIVKYYLEAKDTDSAIEHLKQWLSSSEDVEFVNQGFQLLGDIYTSLGKDAEAVDAYRGALRRDS